MCKNLDIIYCYRVQCCIHIISSIKSHNIISTLIIVDTIDHLASGIIYTVISRCSIKITNCSGRCPVFHDYGSHIDVIILICKSLLSSAHAAPFDIFIISVCSGAARENTTNGCFYTANSKSIYKCIMHSCICSLVLLNSGINLILIICCYEGIGFTLQPIITGSDDFLCCVCLNCSNTCLNCSYGIGSILCSLVSFIVACPISNMSTAYGILNNDNFFAC